MSNIENQPGNEDFEEDGEDRFDEVYDDVFDSDGNLAAPVDIDDL